jgi:hypothetical protein
MNLTEKETRFLTALLREQNQRGCKGPAHALLRKEVYADAPLQGPGSLAFAYEAVSLSSLLLKQFTDLQQIDRFLRDEEPAARIEWPWSSPEEYKARLEQARKEWTPQQASKPERVTSGS